MNHLRWFSEAQGQPSIVGSSKSTKFRQKNIQTRFRGPDTLESANNSHEPRRNPINVLAKRKMLLGERFVRIKIYPRRSARNNPRIYEVIKFSSPRLGPVC